MGEIERYRHLKRGTVYEIIGTAELQAGQPQLEHAELVIYRGEDGKLWARNSAEFHDGRFERVASTDMAGAGEVERSAIKEYLIACADAADAQKLRCSSDTAMRTNLTAEAKAYRNAARMIFEQDHASYRTAAPPVEGLTSGEGWQLVPVDDTTRSFSDSLLPPAMIDAGIAVLEKVQVDSLDYTSGVTTDWDDGMVAVAVYRAMLAASPKATATASVREAELEALLRAVAIDALHTPRNNKGGLIDRHVELLRERIRTGLDRSDSGTAATIGGERA